MFGGFRIMERMFKLFILLRSFSNLEFLKGYLSNFFRFGNILFRKDF